MLSTASSACSRSRSATRERARAVPRPRPLRHQAALLRSTVRAASRSRRELKALFQGRASSRQPQPAAAAPSFLLFGLHDHGEDTFFDGVQRLLPAAHDARAPDGIVKIERYWNLAGERRVRVQSQRRRGAGVARAVPRRASGSTCSPTCRWASCSRAGSTRAASSRRCAPLQPSTDLHTVGLTFADDPGRPSTRANASTRSSASVGDASRTTRTRQLDEFWNEIDEWIWYQEEPIGSAGHRTRSTRVYRLRERGGEGDGRRATAATSCSRATSRYFRGVPHVGDRISATTLRGPASWSRAGDLCSQVLRPRGRSRPRCRRRAPRPCTARDLLRGRGPRSRRARQLRRATQPQRAPRERRAPLYSTPDLLRYEDRNSMAFSIESARAVPRPRARRAPSRAARARTCSRRRPRRSGLSAPQCAASCLTRCSTVATRSVATPSAMAARTRAVGPGDSRRHDRARDSRARRRRRARRLGSDPRGEPGLRLGEFGAGSTSCAGPSATA